jgi:hypothetical protein
MSDLAAWNVHGPVRRLRKEVAEWDENRADWKRPRGLTIAVFRPDGQLSESEFHNPDGSVVQHVHRYDETGRLQETHGRMGDAPPNRIRYFYDAAGRRHRTVEMSADGAVREREVHAYDEAGRKTKFQILARGGAVDMMFGVEGAEASYSAPGAVTCTTAFDERGLPMEAVFNDEAGAAVLRVELSRDADGRVLSEVARSLGEAAWPGLTAVDMPPEERAQFLSMLSAVFAEQAFSTATYRYGSDGRLIERTRKIGALSDERTTFEYDDRGNAILESSEERHREVRMDADGVPQYTDQGTITQDTRFDYVYDEHGNWTERVAWHRVLTQVEFRRSNVERRAITYYEAPQPA